jgi:Zn-dependent protease with chaperone function
MLLSHSLTQKQIILINIFIIFQYILGFEELFNKKLSKLFSNFSFAIFFILFTLFLCFLYLIMLFSLFSKTFLQISSASIPSKTILIREKDKPWFSNDIRKEIRIRDRLRKILCLYVLVF